MYSYLTNPQSVAPRHKYSFKLRSSPRRIVWYSTSFRVFVHPRRLFHIAFTYMRIRRGRLLSRVSRWTGAVGHTNDTRRMQTPGREYIIPQRVILMVLVRLCFPCTPLSYEYSFSYSSGKRPLPPKTKWLLDRVVATENHLFKPNTIHALYAVHFLCYSLVIYFDLFCIILCRNCFRSAFCVPLCCENIELIN